MSQVVFRSNPAEHHAMFDSIGEGTREGETSETHNHIIVGSLDGDWIGGRRGCLDKSARQGWVDMD